LTAPASSGPATGVVAEFDEERGIGLVEDADGSQWFFHCTQIADGTRMIEVGAAVRFEVRPGHLGRWEAAAITPLTRS
jgi:cold shock CspA family protein